MGKDSEGKIKVGTQLLLNDLGSGFPDAVRSEPHRAERCEPSGHGEGGPGWRAAVVVFQRWFDFGGQTQNAVGPLERS